MFTTTMFTAIIHHSATVIYLQCRQDTTRQDSHTTVEVPGLYTAKDIFPVLSTTLSFNFQDFPGPKWFSRTFQVLEFSRKNPGLSRRHGKPGILSSSRQVKQQSRSNPLTGWLCHGYKVLLLRKTTTICTGADLTGGHSCRCRRGPWEAGPWRPRKAKFYLAIAKSWLQLELNLWFI